MDRALRSLCDYHWVTWMGLPASAKSFNASLLGLLLARVSRRHQRDHGLDDS